MKDDGQIPVAASGAKGGGQLIVRDRLGCNAFHIWGGQGWMRMRMRMKIGGVRGINGCRNAGNRHPKAR